MLELRCDVHARALDGGERHVRPLFSALSDRPHGQERGLLPLFLFRCPEED